MLTIRSVSATNNPNSSVAGGFLVRCKYEFIPPVIMAFFFVGCAGVSSVVPMGGAVILLLTKEQWAGLLGRSRKPKQCKRLKLIAMQRALP